MHLDKTIARRGSIDRERGVVISMSKAELLENSARRKIEIAEDVRQRNEARLRGELPFIDRPQPGPPLVRKTFQQPEQPGMDAATAERWNFWCDQRISAAVIRSQELLASALGSESGEIHREINQQIEELRTEIAALRADLTIMAKSKMRTTR